MTGSAFRVIVVGGGPVGLTTAHILTKANIDFVVLERGPTVHPDIGACFAIWPQTVRTLDQLGLYEAVLSISHECETQVQLTHKGKQFNRIAFPIKKSHGHGNWLVPRAEYLKCLFDNLPAESKARIHTGKKVIDLQVDDDHASVTCEDGSIFEGSIIVGADGVHSRVRSLTRTLALADSPSAKVNEEHPYLSTFQILFGSTERPGGGVVTGEVYESHGNDRSTQLHISHDRAFYFIYRRLEKPTRESVKYSEKEMEQFAEEMGDIHVLPNLTIRELLAKKTAMGMVNLEEGFTTQPSWKRVVLVGDAVRKMTPNFGWGYNSGVLDVVVLIGHLRECLAACADKEPCTQALEELFSRCSTERAANVKAVCDMSAQITRSSTWFTWLDHVLDRFLFPWTGAVLLLNSVAVVPLVRDSPVLDWLPEENLEIGQYPWTKMPKTAGKV
ncbi:FAD/NAD(P)-binding domain-containing protein [Thozetella sp. PMI_491]|nr:FAD/NAD(P)-binding domain-containing protein [Thozetella sp. PMI_491]